MDINRRQFLQLGTATGVALTLPVKLSAAPVMPTRPIPATGDPLPVIGLGNSMAFRSGDLTTARRIVLLLLDHGGRLIDTRGRSTVVLGQIAQELNADLFYANNISAASDQDGQLEIQQVKLLQGKTTLDLLQISHLSDINTTWRTMQAWKDSGHTRYIGVAIARPSWYEDLEALMNTGTMDFVQLNYSILEPESGERLLPLARDKGIAVITNRPFMNGNYFRRVKGKPLPDWAGEFDCTGWAQFSLKWILANPAVNCILTETANPDHAEENLSAAAGRLPDPNQLKQMTEYIRSL